ncbi:MAG: sulfite dehydrogenase [Gemmatimonadaceae bacterium]
MTSYDHHAPTILHDAHDAARAESERPTDALSRRALLAGAAAAAAGAVIAAMPLDAQQGTAIRTDRPPVAPPPATTPPATTIPLDATKVPGTPTTPLGARATFVTAARTPVGIITGPSFTPLQDLKGTITPADLHFERHHGGVAHIDPARYALMVHGLVDRPTMFSLRDLERFPSVSRVCFVECSGNGRNGYRAPKPELSPQLIDGLTSNSEWTGVPLRTLLAEAGVKRSATWLLAEGGDAAVLSRSIPMAKAMDDALVAYAQNGEPIRPANGFPVRLLLPGWEANMCIKWLRRIEAIAQPNMSRDETSKYTDPLPNGTARQFSFVMDVKSIITSPAFPLRLVEKGWLPITGLAWTGRGKVARVDVSTDGGKSWTEAELQGPVHSKAHTRFQHMWEWDGGPATLMSRAVDETGAVQPTLAEFRAKRGPGTDFHFNHVRAWMVQPDGRVLYGVNL